MAEQRIQDQKNAEIERARQEVLGREQARRDAEMAKRAKEAARKQASAIASSRRSSMKRPRN